MVILNTSFVSLYEVWTCRYAYSEVYIEGILGKQFGVIKNDPSYFGLY